MGKRLGRKVSGRYREVAAIRRFTTNMGKRLGLKVSGRYREVEAIRRWPHFISNHMYENKYSLIM